MGDLTRNFNARDFQCTCSTCAEIPDRPLTELWVVDAVQELRDILDEPLVVTRGVSCEAHNEAIGGAKLSYHLPQFKIAVDIEADSEKARRIIRGAEHLNRPPTCMRVYAKHVHLDWRPGPRIFIASPEDGRA